MGCIKFNYLNQLLIRSTIEYQLNRIYFEIGHKSNNNRRHAGINLYSYFWGVENEEILNIQEMMKKYTCRFECIK